MYNFNKILYFLFTFLLMGYNVLASQGDNLNEELSTIIKQTFKEQICNDNFKEEQLEITPINFQQEEAGHTLALYKVTQNLPNSPKTFFVKFHSHIGTSGILGNHKVVKDYFYSKQLTHVTVVHDLWSDVVNGYKFSVFPYINAPTLEKVVDSYFSKPNPNSEVSIQSSQLNTLFEKLGCAIGELHKIGLISSDDILTHGIRGDLHDGNILCHPSEGIFIIDNGTYAEYIHTPMPMEVDLNTIFLQSIRLPIGFIEEGIINGTMQRGMQEKVTQWYLAFCKGYIQILSETKQDIRSYLVSCTQNVLRDILPKRDKIFSTQDYKIFGISACKEWIQTLIQQIQDL